MPRCVSIEMERRACPSPLSSPKIEYFSSLDAGRSRGTQREKIFDFQRLARRGNGSSEVEVEEHFQGVAMAKRSCPKQHGMSVWSMQVQQLHACISTKRGIVSFLHVSTRKRRRRWIIHTTHPSIAEDSPCTCACKHVGMFIESLSFLPVHCTCWSNKSSDVSDGSNSTHVEFASAPSCFIVLMLATI